MRRSKLAFALLVPASLALGSLRLFAGDAPAPTADDAQRVERLIEDLGSADFRIREAATKGLIDLGEKARGALTTASKSENPAVRFRADQILQGLDGGRAEKPLDDAARPPAGAGRPRKQQPTDGTFEDAMRDVEKWRQQFERQMAELRERWAKDFGALEQGMPQFRWNVAPGIDAWRVLRDRGDLKVTVESGSTVLSIVEGSAGTNDAPTQRLFQATRKRQARAILEIRSNDDAKDVARFEGKSVAAILEKRPMLREWPGVADLLEKYEAAKKERAERAKREDAAPAGRGTVLENRTVSIESAPGRVKVTISQAGPDGTPVTKTYEGTDLESLKSQHPELREALGGFSVHVGPGGGVRRWDPRGARPGRDDDDEGDDEDDDEMEDDDDDEPGDDDSPMRERPTTGPFGLGIGNVDDARRESGAFPTGGAVVLTVRDGSDASSLGLKVGDVITKVNDTLVDSADKVVRVIRALDRGQPLSVSVLRDGKPMTMTVTLGRLPQPK